MSASLVGSEMCIRDSFALRECHGRAQHGRGAAHRGGAAGGLLLGLHEGSVSYTHLTLPTICSV
eukprot:9442529-Alexandrium_andersonii.AAC.1